MDRETYDSFSDVLRWETLLLLVAVRANYKGIVDFHFDVKDAFQATRVDTAKSDAVRKQPRVFCHQAPGFVKLDPDGVPYVLEVLTAHQGRIDSARLFGQEFGASCAQAGCYRSVWDNELWLFHHGPEAKSADDLVKVLAYSQNMPAVDGAPPGFAAFGRHVDDGMGIITSEPLLHYLIAKIESHGNWNIKTSKWSKMLGYTCDIQDSKDTSLITLSCLPYLQNLARVHLEGETIVKPKHPYPSTILQTQAGDAPVDGSPERADYLLMQEKARSALGSSIWAMRVHHKLVYPTNTYCAFMSNPSLSLYKGWKQSLMHELAFPTPVRFGGYGYHSLTVSLDPVPPFTGSAYDLGLHVLFDANLGAPRRCDTQSQGAISSGTTPTDPPAASKSVTGGLIMLGGGPIGVYCQRQHLISPDSHTAEITAGGTILHRVIPLVGILQECLIPQLHPVPTYTDSQSTIFAANTAAAAKYSVWLNRRTAVIREAVDMGLVRLLKISDANNCSNYFTKPVTTQVMQHYFSYTHPATRTVFEPSV